MKNKKRIAEFRDLQRENLVAKVIDSRLNQIETVSLKK